MRVGEACCPPGLQRRWQARQSWRGAPGAALVSGACTAQDFFPTFWPRHFMRARLSIYLNNINFLYALRIHGEPVPLSGWDSAAKQDAHSGTASPTTQRPSEPGLGRG